MLLGHWGMADSPGTNFAAVNKGEELFGGLNLGLAGSLLRLHAGQKVTQMCAFYGRREMSIVEEKMLSASDNMHTNTRVKPVQIGQHTGMTGARPSAVLLSLVELRVGNSLAASASLFCGMDLNFFDILPSSNWSE